MTQRGSLTPCAEHKKGATFPIDQIINVDVSTETANFSPSQSKMGGPLYLVALCAAGVRLHAAWLNGNPRLLSSNWGSNHGLDRQ